MKRDILPYYGVTNKTDGNAAARKPDLSPYAEPQAGSPFCDMNPPVNLNYGLGVAVGRM